MRRYGIAFILMLTVLTLVACVNRPASNTGYLPVLSSMEVKRANTDYVDEDNVLCLQVTKDIDSKGQEVGDAKCESVQITLHFLNQDELPIISLKVNDDVYTADNFIADVKYKKITLMYRPKQTKGDLDITVHSIFYRKGNASKEIAHLTNNIVPVKIAPQFELTMNLMNSIAPINKRVQKQDVMFMEKFMDIKIFYDDEQMSYVEEYTRSLDYCKKGYGFLGWYTQEDGKGQKVDIDGRYEFYQDITLYAHFEPLYTYEVMQDNDGEDYAVITGLTSTGKKSMHTLYVYDAIDDYTIKEIGAGAMQQASPQYGITIPDTVEIIGNNAFMGLSCTIALGSGVKVIGDYAFSDCTGFTRSFAIPDSVTTIGNYAFKGVVWDTIVKPGSTEGKKTLIIPRTVQHIGEGAFIGNKFEKIFFLNNSDLEYMGKEAFANSKSLNTMGTAAEINGLNIIVKDISGSIEKLSEKAFYNCDKLKTVYLNEGLVIIGENAFSRTIIATLNIPSSVEEICDNSFANYSLKTISFAEESQLRIIGDNAFEGAEVTEVDINSRKLMAYGKSPFYNSETLRIVKINSTIVPAFDTGGLQRITMEYVKYLVPDELLNDFRNEWKPTDSLGNPVEIRIYSRDKIFETPGNNSQKFGYEDYENGVKITFMWNDLSSMNVPTNVDGKPVLAIGRYVANSDITTAKLPSSVKVIDSYAFYNCEKLVSVNFNELTNLENIGSYAFSKSKITSFTSLASLKSIGKGAFQSCSEITEVKLIDGNNINVGAESFNTCNKMAMVVLGLGVEYVNSAAFAYGDSLSQVYIAHEYIIPTSSSAQVGVFRGAKKETGTDDSGNKGLKIYLKSQTVIDMYENENRDSKGNLNLYRAYKGQYAIIPESFTLFD